MDSIVRWAALGAALALAPSRSAAAQGCDGSCVPLPDLGAGTYLGAVGGLYPGGSNDPPPAHLDRLLHAADAVVPRDAAGVPDPDGRVGVLGVGPSTLSEYLRVFERGFDGDPGRNGYVTFVNGGLDGVLADSMADPAHFYWGVLDDRVAAAGLTAEQVQVVLLEQVRVDIPYPGFAVNVQLLQDDLRTIVRDLHDRFPNVRVCFLWSVLYAGYTILPIPGEPRAYEQGFSVQGLIAEQIAGDPRLNPDPALGPVEAPVLAWGPYVWGFAETPRLDGVVWHPEDFEPDGLHPSFKGERKTASLIESWMDGFEPARRIFDARAGVTRGLLEPSQDATVDASAPGANAGASPFLDVELGVRTSYLRFDLDEQPGAVRSAHLLLEADSRAGSVRVREVSDDGWSEGTITAANAPPPDGATTPPCSLTSTTGVAVWDVTGLVPRKRGKASLALVEGAPGNPSRFVSREGRTPPWLALVLDLEPGGVEPYCPGRPNGVGRGASLEHEGSPSLAADDLVLVARGLPPGAVYVPVVSDAANEAPLGDGTLCVGGTPLRLPVGQADTLGEARVDVDWAAPPLAGVQAGDRRFLQIVYRDAGPSGLNLTGALVVRLAP